MESNMAVNSEETAERRAEAQVGETVQNTALLAGYAVQKVGGAARFIAHETMRVRKSKKEEAIPEFPAEPSNPSHAPNTACGTSAPEHSQAAPTPESRGRDLARTRARERGNRLREAAGERITSAESKRETTAGGKRPANGPAKPPRKPPAPRLRDASEQAEKTAHMARLASQRARLLAVRTRQAAQATVAPGR